MDGTRGNGLVNVGGCFDGDGGQKPVVGVSVEPLVLQASVSRYLSVPCPYCHVRHDIVPSLVLKTVNPGRIPCTCGGVIEVVWR